MLRLDALSVGYAGARGAVLAPATLSIEPGAFVCVLGRNGAGKSTLMRTIAGLQAPLSGHAFLDDADIHRSSAAERARRIAVVLTERPSSPGLTVDDVISLGRQPFTDWRGRMKAEDKAIAQAAARDACVESLCGRLFDDLSDGERQRVIIARAMAQTPQLMILDEITAFLDLPGRVEAMSLLRRRARESGTAIILSSHDLDLSLQLADAVWLIDGGALHAGPADALIADGKIGAAFDTADVAYSAGARRFELRRETSSSTIAADLTAPR